MNNKTDLTITLKNITLPQAVAFVHFAKKLEYCGRVGQTRYVAFYADGDGDFRPTVEHNLDMSDEQLAKYREYAEKTIETILGTHIAVFDFDDIYYLMDQEAKTK